MTSSTSAAVTAQAAKATMPTAPKGQLGFADLLGVTGEDANAAITTKTSKSGVRYALLPIASKTNRSLKSEFGLTAGGARARYARELVNFSTRAFSGVSGAIASGKVAIASVVMKDSGRMTVNLVPMECAVVQAPMDIESIRKFLAANPEAAKQLTA